MSEIVLEAPCAGWVAPLSEVPDPVFAERMVGEGIAIEPLEDLIRAPCDATVILVAATQHSITLRLANGAELLIHVGIDTVALGGAGFAMQVREGSQVSAGDVLLRFDLDTVAAAAKSLITPIIVANDGFRICDIVSGRIDAGAPLMKISADRQQEADAAAADTAIVKREIVVALANGVHARPAALIAAALKPLSADVEVSAHQRTVNGRSPVSLMTLGLKKGDVATVTARGPSAHESIAAIERILSADHETPAASPGSERDCKASGSRHTGVVAAPGLAIGPLIRYCSEELDVPEAGRGIAAESAALRQALDAQSGDTASQEFGAGAAIAAAHRALIEDPELLVVAQAAIDGGCHAAFAWRLSVRQQAEALRATGDPLLIERITDLHDIETQVIGAIMGISPATRMPALPRDAILVADDLMPSQFMALYEGNLAGIATARGGPTSHLAILAASAGIPLLVACGPDLLTATGSGLAILDADKGIIDVSPDDASLVEARQRQDLAAQARAALAASASDDCIMADGSRIEIFANLASVDDAARAVALGAEGCGLLRTEFLFLDRPNPPSEDEQCLSYRAIARALDGRPLIVRTLDVGGDKPASYLSMPVEPNPALGVRGVRVHLERPDLLATQLRAILRGMPAEQCRIMVPMIVDVAELRAVRTILEEACKAVGIGSAPPLGVMVETPAAAMLADQLAAEADFLSIGSNDLTQYALAADRGNPGVAAMIDPLHPAVLRLIAEAGKGAARHGRWLGLCGSLASSPKAAALLIGLGVTELSVVASRIAELKAIVRHLSMTQCREIAAQALQLSSAVKVWQLLEEATP